MTHRELIRRAGFLFAMLIASACQLDTEDAARLSGKPSQNAPIETVAMIGMEPEEPATSEPLRVDIVPETEVRPLGIEQEIEKRNEDYKQVLREAEARGLLGGAVRGGIIGLLVAGNPEGALVGALLGGSIGASVSERAASELIAEHQNYIIRRWSLETVLRAARNDTENTRFDLLLSTKALEQVAGKNQRDGTASVAITEDSIALLSNFQNRAETRALTLREVMPLYQADMAASTELLNELESQIDMIAQLRANVAMIKGE